MSPLRFSAELPHGEGQLASGITFCVLGLWPAFWGSQRRKTASEGVPWDRGQWRDAWGRGTAWPSLSCSSRGRRLGRGSEHLLQVRREAGSGALRVRRTQMSSHTGRARGYHMCPGLSGEAGGGGHPHVKGPVQHVVCALPRRPQPWP